MHADVGSHRAYNFHQVEIFSLSLSLKTERKKRERERERERKRKRARRSRDAKRGAITRLRRTNIIWSLRGCRRISSAVRNSARRLWLEHCS